MRTSQSSTDVPSNIKTSHSHTSKFPPSLQHPYPDPCPERRRGGDTLLRNHQELSDKVDIDHRAQVSDEMSRASCAHSDTDTLAGTVIDHEEKGYKPYEESLLDSETVVETETIKGESARSSLMIVKAKEIGRAHV